MHVGGEEIRIVDPSGKVRSFAEDDGTGNRPEVDRGQLRDLLLDGLPECGVPDAQAAWAVDVLLLAGTATAVEQCAPRASISNS